jgi:hypothetical protein
MEAVMELTLEQGHQEQLIQAVVAVVELELAAVVDQVVKELFI